MKLFEKLEDILNAILIKIGQLLLKLVPKGVKQKFEKWGQSLRAKKQALGKKIGAVLSKVFSILIYLPQKLSSALGWLTSFSLTLSQKLRSKDTFVRYLEAIAIPIRKVANKIVKKVESLRPQTVATILILLAVFIFAGIVVVGNTKKIVDSTSSEQIEEKVAPQELRKDYYQQDERQLLVSELTIPIYVGKGNAPRTLILDVTLKMSNRYLKSYFYDNDYLLKDRLNRTIEPVIPTLPLEAEGKQIIRDKIIEEVDKLIIERKIKGHVDDVYFHNIING